MFPLVITICIIINAIFCILRVNAAFPLVSEQAHSNFNLMIYFNCVNLFFLMSAFWLFALKYFETAVEIAHIIDEDVKQLGEGSWNQTNI